MKHEVKLKEFRDSFVVERKSHLYWLQQYAFCGKARGIFIPDVRVVHKFGKKSKV